MAQNPIDLETAPTPSRDRGPTHDRSLGQIVLVLQGGGALGAYQAGVYEALHEAGIEPDWVIGTSIGAINASLIAGNESDQRLHRLKEFWSRMGHGPQLDLLGSLPFVGRGLTNWATIWGGIEGFFKPNGPAFVSPYVPLAPEAAAYYSTAQLEQTLCDLVDFDRLARCAPRLTVGAANLRTSAMRYFDSRDEKLSARHVMASGALPPAFPPVRIGDDLYWDGGILSNTPVEAVFDDNPRRDSLVFVVHIWNPEGVEPKSIWQVMNRQKDVQYSSRAVSHIMRQKQIHRLRHIISELAARLPEADRKSEQIRSAAAYGCTTQMHIVRLMAPRLDPDDHTKDIDFSRTSIRTRWQAGYVDTKRMIEAAPWVGEFDPIEGFHLHEMRSA